MALYFIVGSRDLRARVTAACSSFYMPFGCCALVPFNGTVAQLAQRLVLLSSEDRRSGYGFSPLNGWVARIFPS
jgi:hypothetical protein